MDKKTFKKEVLSLLVRNARISTQEIANRLGASEGEVLATIAELEKEQDDMTHIIAHSIITLELLKARWEREKQK